MDMKRTSFAFFVVLFALGATTAKAQSTASDSTRIADLAASLEELETKSYLLYSQVSGLKKDILSLKESDESQSERFDETMERLSQSERAMNGTLEQFQQKFEDQNATIKEVQGLLNQRMDQMRTYIIVGIVAILVLMYVLVKMAMGAAVKKHTATFNEFQEHLLKTK